MLTKVQAMDSCIASADGIDEKDKVDLIEL